MEIPVERESQFEAGGRIAIDQVFSPEFERFVEAFVSRYASDPRIAHNWDGWTSERIVRALRRTLPGSRLGTRDGWWQWVRYHVAGNLADEPTSNRSATVNRWGLRHASPSAIANSLVHEAAHAAGMRHDKPGKACGPAYLVGDIVEEMADSGTVDVSRLCFLLDN